MWLILWICLVAVTPLVSSVSVVLEPLQTTPHLKLCNINQQCEDLVLILDSGSTDLWLSDATCKTCQAPSVKCLPQPIRHNSFEKSPGKWVQLVQKEIQYGIGWVKGYEVDYTLCGMTTKVLCVTSSKDIEQFVSHGVLGIGGRSSGRQFILQLIHNFNTTQMLSMFFGRFFAELTVGGYNEDYVSEGSVVQYYNSTYDWTLQITLIEFGAIKFNQRIVALVDSGSSLMVLPESMFNLVYFKLSHITEQRCSHHEYGIVCGCSDPLTVSKFPPIDVYVQSSKNESHKYTIASDLYISWRKGFCVLSITSMKKYDGILILGRSFLKQYITVFDIGSNRIGLIEANLKGISHTERLNLGITIMMVFALVCISSKSLTACLCHKGL